MYLISDNVDTLTGFRLVGIDGAVVHDEDGLKAELSKAVADKDLAILLITEKLNSEFLDIVRAVQLNRSKPLIVQIPDRHGTTRGSEFITAYVKEAIGLKI